MQFVGTDFSALLAQVKNKKFDLGSSSITITDARKKTVDFTNGYDFGYFGLDVPDGSDIKGFDQLKGKRVAVVQGTVQDDYATKEGLNPVRVPDYNSALNQLKSGTAQAWVAPAEIGEKTAKDSGGKVTLAAKQPALRRRPSPCPRKHGVPHGAQHRPGPGDQGRHLDQAAGAVLPGPPVPKDFRPAVARSPFPPVKAAAGS